jgi:hypothetical protein
MIEELPSKRPAVRDVKTLSVYHDCDGESQCVLRERQRQAVDRFQSNV